MTTVNVSTPQPSITVVSPNGGETWVKGTTQHITWTGTPSSLNQTGDIKLEFAVPACTQPGQPIRCMIAVRAPITIVSGVSLNYGSYAWKVGNSVPLAIPCGAFAKSCPNQMTLIADGQYKIQICPTKVNSSTQCDDSNNYFIITSSTSTQPPVISGGTFPTTLQVNQTGTWTVKASDPQNSPLSYSVNWGDTSQGSSFTHSYSSPGTYTITFTVKDAAGLSAQTTTTVKVGNVVTPSPTPVCPIGYICTPPNQTTICLAGYTCTNVTYNCPSGFICHTQTPIIQPPASSNDYQSSVPPIPLTSSNNYTSSSSYQSSASKPSPVTAAIWNAIQHYFDSWTKLWQ